LAIEPTLATAFAEMVIAAGATEVEPDTGDVSVAVGPFASARAFVAAKAPGACNKRAPSRMNRH
jgi:2-methylaconitate cis-trans-isomerase PrpF